MPKKEASSKDKKSGFERTSKAQARDDLFDNGFSLNGEDDKNEQPEDDTSKKD